MKVGVEYGHHTAHINLTTTFTILSQTQWKVKELQEVSGFQINTEKLCDCFLMFTKHQTLI